MPNDVITLNALSKELDKILTGGRIEKVGQPEVDEIHLLIKNNRAQYNLIASANATKPRLHISKMRKENQLVAPAFCMLLRKYLVGAYIEKIQIYNSDRIIKIDLKSKNELKDINSYSLMIELMGRYSNIILLDKNNKILDAIRRINFDESTTRYILPNITYTPQPQNRISLYDNSALLDFFNTNKNLNVDTLIKNVSGISKESALEIISSNNPYEKLLELLDIEKDTYKPCLKYVSNKIQDFCVQPYIHTQGEYLIKPSLNECLDEFFTLYDSLERQKSYKKKVNVILKRLKEKTERRINDNEQKIKDFEKATKYKEYGDLIISNIYRIKNFDTQLTCESFTDGSVVNIPLDNTKSPSENAQSYYKKYAKLKHAAQIATSQLDELKSQQEYLEQISATIEICTQKQEFDEILDELTSLSGLRKSQFTYSKHKTISKPIHFKVNGFDVYVGKNNLQNNDVTFEIGDRNDLWLHVKDFHGTHVIIKGEPDNDTIYKCAQVAAFYSTGKESEKVEVTYTLRKNIKKIPNAMLGMVTYTNYKSILVPPQDYLTIQDK